MAATVVRAFADERLQRRSRGVESQASCVPRAPAALLPRGTADCADRAGGERSDPRSPSRRARREVGRDRPDQAESLAAHWGVGVSWFEGGHLAQIGRNDALREVRRQLGAIGLWRLGSGPDRPVMSVAPWICSPSPPRSVTGVTRRPSTCKRCRLTRRQRLGGQRLGEQPLPTRTDRRDLDRLAVDLDQAEVVLDGAR